MRDLREWLRRLSPLADPAIVLIVLLLTLQPLLQGPDQPAWAYALVVAQCLPLAVRRRWPFAVALVCGLLTAVYGVSTLPDPPVPYAGLVGVYSAAAYCTTRRAYAVAGFAAAGVLISLLADPFADLGDAVFLLAVFATAWLLGDAARRRRDLAREMQQRAEELERTRAAEAAAAAAAERNRIAREMHDVVAHHLSMMVVQAEAGPVVAAGDPERAVSSFDAISAAGKQALVEMRQLLGVLKDGERAELRPAPGADDIGELVAGVRSAGLDIRFETSGTARPLPAAVDLAVYRLVQEALTNCLRHAEASLVEVDLDYTDDSVRVTVTDDGRGGGPQADSGGHGLVAMRERVSLLGGTIEAGPRSGRGWTVHAVLPTGAGVRS